MTAAAQTTTIAVRRAELLELKRLQLDAEIAGQPKPSLSEVIRQLLDEHAAAASSATAAANGRHV
jgi:hypothetical protein